MDNSEPQPRKARLPLRLQVRRAAVLVHRYVGLTIAGFLLVAGLTGCMMAFYPQLDALLNPELYLPKGPIAGRTPMDPFTLRERLLAQLPEATAKKVQAVLLKVNPERAVNYWVDGRETFVDPYSGEVLGSREFGNLREGKKTLLTFIYKLHFSLGLGEVGSFLFGCAALLWTIDCFVGAYLTFPPPRSSGERRRKSWLSRWLPSWLLKTAKLYSFIFTWHRASGLWVWLMLFVFAWSSVALNLGDVYAPVMAKVFGPAAPDPWEALPHLPTPREEPSLSLRDAHLRGRDLMAAEAQRRSFQIHQELSLGYDPEHGVYNYTVESSLDVSERLAETTVAFDGDTGKQLFFTAPTGANTSGTISSWFIALHFGSVREGGLAYRWFVCLMGLGVAALSITGIWIWWKKRSSRAVRSGSIGGA